MNSVTCFQLLKILQMPRYWSEIWSDKKSSSVRVNPVFFSPPPPRPLLCSSFLSFDCRGRITCSVVPHFRGQMTSRPDVTWLALLFFAKVFFSVILIYYCFCFPNNWRRRRIIYLFYFKVVSPAACDADGTFSPCPPPSPLLSAFVRFSFLPPPRKVIEWFCCYPCASPWPSLSDCVHSYFNRRGYLR